MVLVKHCIGRRHDSDRMKITQKITAKKNRVFEVTTSEYRLYE